MDRWRNKVAVVTGASAGIGAAIVTELIKHGVNVVGVARRVDRIEELANSLKSQPGKLVAKQADVSKEDDIIGLFKWLKSTYGTINILVNNAGVIRYGKLYEQDPKYWRQILDTNVLGLSICTQEAIKLMREAGVNDGHIIHINSIVGHFVPNVENPLTAMYAASKHAITALTETLRQELRFMKSQIKISSVSPGWVRTEIVDASNAVMRENEKTDDDKLWFMKGEPRPCLESKDIADGVIYVLSTPPRVQVHELTIKPVGEPV